MDRAGVDLRGTRGRSLTTTRAAPAARPPRARLLLLALIALLGGCVEGPDALAAPFLEEDFLAFAEHGQPVLAERCANPACHGRADRPLRVFARFQHRLDPAAVHLDEPLTEEELWQNYRRARALVRAEAPEASALLLKPLSEAQGGSHHRGGVQFEDPFEADYRALRLWVEQGR